MRAIVQRVSSASVEIEGKIVSSIGPGLLLLVGAARGDSPENAKKLADRVFGMRIFSDQDGKMNLNITDWYTGQKECIGSKPEILAVSNFTVFADASQRRPSFGAAAGFEEGKVLFEKFTDALEQLGAKVQTGVFGADMRVQLVNDGPVTLVVDC